MTSSIIIQGKRAKQIYDQILCRDRAINIENNGTEEEPTLVIREC